MKRARRRIIVWLFAIGIGGCDAPLDISAADSGDWIESGVQGDLAQAPSSDATTDDGAVADLANGVDGGSSDDAAGDHGDAAVDAAVDSAGIDGAPDASPVPDLSVAACANGVKDGRETDVDCGGPDCLPCPAAKGCVVDTDCAALACLDGGHCAVPIQFATPANVPILQGSEPRPIVAGDLDKDGALDLIVGNVNPNMPYTVSTLLGKGDGTFKPELRETTRKGPAYGLAAADFNGDGKLDLLAEHDSLGWVGWLPGNGDGTLGTETSIGWAPTVGGVVAGDLNGDGRPDVAVTLPTGAQVAVYMGMGGGLFALPQSYMVGMSPVAIAIGDVDGDGKPDLVTADHGGGLTPLANLGNGALAAKATIPVAAKYLPAAVAIADLDGNGAGDLLAASDPPQGMDALASVDYGGANFQFTAGANLKVGPFPQQIATADFNGDGNPDAAVVCGGFGSVALLIGKGHGQLVNGPSITLGGATMIVAADLNGDGQPDLAVTDSPGSRVRVLLNVSK